MKRETVKASNGVTLAKTATKLVRSCKPRNILISLRCTAAMKELIQQAAKAEGQAVQKFVLEAATIEARLVLYERTKEAPHVRRR